MVQPLSQTPGFVAISPSILQQEPAETDPINTQSLPTSQEAPIPEARPVQADVSQATSVAPVESGNAPAAASTLKPSEQQVDFFSQLGNVLSSLLSPTDSASELGDAAGAAVPAKVEQAAPPMETQDAPAVVEAKTNVPELKGYKSVIQEATKVEEKRPTSKTSNRFLDLIGKAEGTDKGRGYNEALGYGAFSGGPKDLSNMTLDEIDKLQGAMLRHPGNKYNSSALGRYQIVRRTLRGVRGKVGLKGSDKFSPENQDKLALQILKEQGPGAWEGLKQKQYWGLAQSLASSS